ncbi:hypothetical protein COOONC_17213 [Cooperia oncophora]
MTTPSWTSQPMTTPSWTPQPMTTPPWTPQPMTTPSWTSQPVAGKGAYMTPPRTSEERPLPMAAARAQWRPHMTPSRAMRPRPRPPVQYLTQRGPIWPEPPSQHSEMREQARFRTPDRFMFVRRPPSSLRMAQLRSLARGMPPRPRPNGLFVQRRGPVPPFQGENHMRWTPPAVGQGRQPQFLASQDPPNETFSRVAIPPSTSAPAMQTPTWTTAATSPGRAMNMPLGNRPQTIVGTVRSGRRRGNRIGLSRRRPNTLRGIRFKNRGEGISRLM